MRFNSKAAASVGLSVVFFAASSAVLAQDGKAPWEEYDKLISSKKAIATLGPQMFGDAVDLASGALTFSATDVSIAGNDRLPVAVTRTLAITSEKTPSRGGIFGDWDIDIPNISGLFATTWHDNRCDVATPPTLSSGIFHGKYYWKNNMVQMPGGGEPLAIDPAAARPTTGGPYKWITPARTVISCLPAIQNHTGQGFLAVTTDGTTYRFDHMAQYEATDYEETLIAGEGGVGSTTTYALARKKNALYATRVEDRFGNWVEYAYTNAYNEPLRISAITAKDGRSISFTYNSNGLIATVTGGGRTWTYGYDANQHLNSVLQPDGSRWSMDFAAFSNADIEYMATDDPNWRNCKHLMGSLDSGAYVGTITHPSGAVGKFTVAPTLHGRTKVPLVCRNYVPQPYYNATADDVASLPVKWHSISLTTKEITGPGLLPQTWAFSYSGNYSFQYPIGENEPICKTETCLDPVCLDDSCASAATTTIIGPSGDWKRYSFGNTYRYNEGKLLKIEEGLSADLILRTTNKSYDLAQSGRAYPVRLGASMQPYSDGFTAEFPRPEVATVITQQDVTFSRAVDTDCAPSTGFCLDKFLRPTRVVRSSSLDYSSVNTTEYFDQEAKWVLGQVWKVTDVATGKVISQTNYDTTTALPLASYRFGALQHTLSYNADGTLATVKDGRNNVVTLSSWKRGIPQNISYPGAVPTTEKALVDDRGNLTWVEDELATRTNYSYDAMDRLSGITFPTGDTTAWNATSLPFVAVTTTEYGIPGGHWKQTIKTGTGQTTTYYDAQWRPVLVVTEDTTTAASKSFVVNRYDAAGRLAFTSYPVGSLSTVNDTLQGSTTEYDALGRVTKVLQDSELGVLTSTTEYLTGFQTRTTNPRGFATTTSFQAFDSPDTSRPVLIQAPEGVTTTITRDGFGNPLTVSRSGAGN